MENKKVVISIDGKESVSLSVPQNSIVTVEDGVTIVEPKIKKYIPKVGDCVKVDFMDFVGYCVVSKIKSDEIWYHVMIDSDSMIEKQTWFSFDYSIEKITPAELQAEFKKLGYVYDFDTNTASKIRWRAVKGGEYWFIQSDGTIGSDNEDFCRIDDNQHNHGNYFKTEELAEQFKSIQSKALITFHNQYNG